MGSSVECLALNSEPIQLGGMKMLIIILLILIAKIAKIAITSTNPIITLLAMIIGIFLITMLIIVAVHMNIAAASNIKIEE